MICESLLTMSDVLLMSFKVTQIYGLKIFTSLCAAVRVPMQERGEMHSAVSEMQPQVKNILMAIFSG